MASLVGNSNHGLSSLVLNRSRPNASRQTPSEHAAMPPALPDNFVVISDDDEGANVDQDVEHLRTVRVQSQHSYAMDGNSSSHIRPDIEGSPLLRRDGKRQKLLDGSRSLSLRASSPDAAGPSGFTHAQLRFDSDDGGFTQAYPDFFADAFVHQEDARSNGSDNNFGALVEPMSTSPKLKKKEVHPPYFEDPKLHIRMFRGPGCEHFALPVDADPKYKEFCDNFDLKIQLKEERRRQKQRRSNHFGSYIDETVEVEESDLEEDAKSPPVSMMEAECLAQIREILPDADHEFLLRRIRTQHESWKFGDEEIEVLPDTGAIIAELLEMDDYPKARKQEEIERDPFEDETGKTIKWSREHRNHRDYQKDAIILLASQYDYVPTHYISKVVHEKRTIWDAYIHIEDVDTTYFQRPDKPYNRSRRPRIQLEKKYQRSVPYHDPQYYPSLIAELQATRQYVAREILRKSQDQARIDAERANLEEQKAQGLIVQCQCCFDDEVPMNRAVSCTASSAVHSFCFGCVEGLANNQIGLMKHQMLCMDASGCQEKLDMDGIGRAVPIKTFDRLLFNEQHHEIAAANIEGLEQCPFCDFKAICEPMEHDPVFSCQNPDCFKVTCRKCHENSHLPKTCEEVKKDRGLEARHKIEEARSEAMMRPCPQCKKKIIKELGCNKLRCTCGAVICYVCKLDLSKLRDGYDHFNKGERKCPLYDTPGVNRHDQDADDAERKAIGEARAEDDTIEESALQIETGKGNAAAKTTVAPHPPAPNVPAHRVQIRPQHFGERLAAMREGMRGRRVEGRAAAVPIMGTPPLLPASNMPQNRAMDPQHAYVDGTAAPVANGPGPANDIGVRRAELRRLQEQVMGLNAVPAQWRQAGGDIYGDIWQQRIAAIDTGVAAALNENAGELDMLITGQRIHNYRTDIARRRESQVQRRNTFQSNTNQPLQLPNPAFLNLRYAPQRVPNLADQSQPQAANHQVYQGQQADDFGGWIPKIPQNDGPFDPLGFTERADETRVWRDQFRPPTPVPAKSGPVDRNEVFRRQTVPNNAFNAGGYQQNSRAPAPPTPPARAQGQEQPPHGWI